MSRIRSVTPIPISFRVPEGQNVTLGIGRAVKRDAVLVKVETENVCGFLLVHNVSAHGLGESEPFGGTSP